MARVYEYKCKECGLSVEHAEPDLIFGEHLGCDGDLKRVFSLGGVILKGSGFYRTDNK